MVDVYRCLTRARLPWSLRDSGRVVGHRDALALRDVEFRVSTAGCARIRARRQREVVAYARGVLVESGAVPPGAHRVRFHPYGPPAFTLDDGSPISAAALVVFLADGSCWAVPPSLGVSPCVASSSPSR
ncbi:hypothetical protein ASG51_21200 [Methylobacterium sp. Leaf465]|jgi:hypothetical protein|uniref:hypothetical protein n=1 Tax=Methylobacterium sp. Leaf465 TaxID=1736385 RepID=UPI0006F9282A|nr:hypothetical protein [Methylobacterium sp. Leaf465]KQT80916.1 hypothetical protein ASG51_21200 [Methylobacterium sp. Leaf465]